MRSKPQSEGQGQSLGQATSSSLAKFRRRLSEGRISSWVLGGGTAILGWSVALGPLGGGLDQSWGAGLAMATSAGLNFGSEIIFTYGPLGFLRTSPVAQDWLSLASWIYQSTLFVLVAVGSVELLRRSVGPWLAAALTLAVFVLFNIGLADLPLVLAVILAMLVLRREPGAPAPVVLVYGGAVLVAIEFLTKVSSGPIVLLVIALALYGAQIGLRQAGRFGLLSIAIFLGLWFMTGQSLGAIPEYFSNSFEVSSGYREAMTVSDSEELPMAYAAGVLLIALLVVGSAVLGEFRSNKARWSAVMVVALSAAVMVKWATWRYGLGHITAAISTLVLIALAVPHRARFRPDILASTGVLIFGSFFVISKEPENPYTYKPNIDLVSNARAFVSSTRTALDPRRRKDLQEAGRNSLKDLYQVSPELLRDLRGQRVAIEPWEIAMAWAYQLDWDPLPVFQNYSAYTKELDRVNATGVGSSEGPTRILRPLSQRYKGSELFPWGPVFEDRVPVWDPPAQQRAIYCNFVEQARDARWEVLRRVSNRCGELEPVKVVKASFGEEVRVPNPGEDAVTVLRLYGAEVKGLESLWALVVHADSRFAIINGDEADPRRIVPGTTTNGLMVRGGIRDQEGKLPPEIPQIRTLRIEGREGGLRYEFFRMPVKPPKGDQGLGG